MTRCELTNRAWEAYANLEQSFEEAIIRTGEAYQDEANWRLLESETRNFFGDVQRYIRDSILHPVPSMD